MGELEFYLDRSSKSLPSETASGKMDIALLESTKRANTRVYRDIHNLPPEAKCAPGPKITSDESGIGSPLCTRGSVIDYSYDGLYGWRWKCSMEQSSTNCSAVLPASCGEQESISDTPPTGSEACSIGELESESTLSTQTGFAWTCKHIVPNNTTSCQTIGKPVCGDLVGASVSSGTTAATFSGTQACSK